MVDNHAMRHPRKAQVILLHLTFRRLHVDSFQTELVARIAHESAPKWKLRPAIADPAAMQKVRQERPDASIRTKLHS
jgi:hypothetical protein